MNTLSENNVSVPANTVGKCNSKMVHGVGEQWDSIMEHYLVESG